VWGIRGKTPAEIAADIARRSDDDVTEFFPIMLSRDGVEIVILWPGGKLGEVPVLDPAGQYLLPLTLRVRHWYEDDRMRRPRQARDLVRKVANGGVLLASDLRPPPPTFSPANLKAVRTLGFLRREVQSSRRSRGCGL
jgi:hypothetical protein